MNTKPRSPLISIVCALSVAALAFFLYAGTLSHGFVYDDLVIVENNPHIKNMGNAPRLLSSDYFHISGERTFRPLNTFSYMVDHALWKGAPRGFHLTNVLMHAAVCALLFLLFQAVAGRTTALFAALLFAAHPLNTEAVNAVSFREDLMALCFTALGLLLYVRLTRERPRNILTATAMGIVFVLGLASKESAAVLPPAVIACEWVCRPGQAWKQRWARLWPALAGMAMGGAVFAAAYLGLSPHADSAAAAWPDRGVVSVMVPALARYILLFVSPTDLCADYSTGCCTAWGGVWFLNLGLLLTIPLLALLLHRHYRGAAFGLLFFLLALLPVSNIIPFGAVFAERYAYMPLAGLCLAAGCFFFEPGPVSPTPRARIFFMVFLLAITGLLGYLTVQRNHVWASDYTLWQNTAACCPGSSRAHTQFGIALNRRKEYVDAVQHLRRAVELDPDHYEAVNALGNALAQLGSRREAELVLRRAITLNPDSKYTYYNLGLLLHKNGDLPAAKKELLNALHLDPDYMEARLELANVLFDKGRLNPGEVSLLKNILRSLIRELPPDDPRQKNAVENYNALKINTGQ